jgi:hypothetical protein
MGQSETSSSTRMASLCHSSSPGPIAMTALPWNRS